MSKLLQTDAFSLVLKEKAYQVERNAMLAEIKQLEEAVLDAQRALPPYLQVCPTCRRPKGQANNRLNSPYCSQTCEFQHGVPKLRWEHKQV